MIGSGGSLALSPKGRLGAVGLSTWLHYPLQRGARHFFARFLTIRNPPCPPVLAGGTGQRPVLA